MAQLRIPMDDARFSKGLSWKDYMAQMGDTQARTESNYAKSNLTDEEKKFFGSVTGVKYVVMLAENWCGDVHRNSPLIAHIVEAMPGAQLRVFFRDQNADLRDTFLNNGYQSIPVVIFFDKDWNEIGRWLERAHAATTKATNIRANSPQRDRMGTTPGVASGDGVLTAEQVADSVMEAIDQERFWVLPHPEVREYVRRKATDVDRWLHGMQRFQQRLYEGQSPPGEWILPKNESAGRN